MGVGEALTLFPEQIRLAFGQIQNLKFKIQNYNALVVTGMGGSSNAAKILQGVYETELKIPFIVHNDYGLPVWVDSQTLVIANSYSGNTEETLSGIETALKAGAAAIGISTGGKIAEMISSGKIAGVTVTPQNTNPPGFPKSGLGISLGALAGILSKIGIIDLSEIELNSTLNELIDIRNNWKAREMAEWLNGSLPVLFCGRPLIGALNAGRNAMCEISRNFTQFYDFPEVNHVLIEALQKPEPATKNKYLFFESQFLHKRVKTRFEITKTILDEMRLPHTSYILHLTSKLGQALELAHYCAWIGYYLSLRQNSDPGPEPWILKLKDSLSKKA